MKNLQNYFFSDNFMKVIYSDLRYKNNNICSLHYIFITYISKVISFSFFIIIIFIIIIIKKFLEMKKFRKN